MAENGRDGYESFEVNDFDLEQALNPGRRRHKFSKHQQTYGVWADELSDDDADARPTFGGKRRKDYASAPVQFISGGIKQGSGTVKSDEATTSKTDVKNEEIDDAKSSDEDDDPIQISSFKQKGDSRKKTKGQQNMPSFMSSMQNQLFAGMRGSGGKTGEKFGDWERHTKGIGMKLLEKMGYEAGKGLGSQGQGINEPVAAVKRPGRGAIGAYGKEVKGPNFGDSLAKERQGGGSPNHEGESSSEDERRRPTGQWRKDGARRKPKYRYKTIDEVIEEGGSLSRRLDGFVAGDLQAGGGKHSTTKVIDMTGREKKTYTGYEMFSTKTRAPKEDEEQKSRRRFDVPELTHNLNLLLEMTEEEIIRNARHTSFLKNVTLRHEQQQMQSRVINEDRQAERTQQVLVLVEKFAAKSKTKEATLDDCKELISTLQRDYPDEYRGLGLSMLAITEVLPLLRQKFNQWQPLKQPTRNVQLLREWREILEDSAPIIASEMEANVSGAASKRIDPYHKLVWEAVMPVVRRAALTWQPTDDDDGTMIAVIEAYATVTPQWIMENWLEQLVLHRIQTAVDAWNPMTATVPIHSWLHPWLPIMGDRLLPIYPGIRHKLARALHQWHPSDPSAKMVLQPWKGVFSAATMDGFLMQNIAPKLNESMSNLVVNPADQRLDEWHWVTGWKDMLSVERMVQILMRHFFNKWLSALHTWLVSPTANFDEVSQWYSGWKSLFWPQLLEAEQIKAQFTIALDMMNRAVSGQPIPRPTGAVPPMGIVSGAAAAPPVTGPFRYAAAIGDYPPAHTQLNFRDLVEKRAHEAGLSFIPVVNKFREGKPVYQFGSKQIYIDNKVVFLLDETTAKFLPVGLEQLVGMAKR